QPEHEGLEHLTFEFHGDFQDIGILLDVDDEGRLVVQEVSANGEAGKYPTLCQQGLHIVGVGIAGDDQESAADELLRQLITLPRPVRVEFARTTCAPSIPSETKLVASSLSSAAPQTLPSNDSDTSQRAGPVAARPLADGQAHSFGVSGPVEGGTCEDDVETAENYEQSTDGLPASDTGIDKCGTADEEGTQEGKNADHETNEDPFAGSKGKHDKASHRPQRHGTLPEGSDWEEHLRSGLSGSGTLIPADHAVRAGGTAADSSAFHAGGDNDSEKTLESVTAATSTRSSPTHKSPRPMDFLNSSNAEGSRLPLVPGGESSAIGRAPPDGLGSIRSWLQDDSDDSEQEQTTLPRHSWYTANLMRGGHAPDVNNSNSFTRAAALAKARAGDRPPSVVEGAATVTGKNEVAPQGKEPFMAGKNQAPVAPAAVRGGGRSGGRLSNAVSAREHRSPSWCRDDERSGGGESAGGVDGDRSSHGGSRTGARDNIEHAPEEEAVMISNGPAAAPNDPSPTSSPAARQGGERHDKRDGGSGKRPASKAAPRTGGVSARLHHSPSRILRGGATLRSDDAPLEAARASETATRRTKATAAARSGVRNQSSTKATSGERGTTGDAAASATDLKNGSRAPPSASAGRKSSQSASNAALVKKRATAKALPAASSSAGGASKPSGQQDVRGVEPRGKSSGGRDASAAPADGGQSRETKHKSTLYDQAAAADPATVTGACATAARHDLGIIDGPTGRSPPVMVAANQSRERAIAARGTSSKASSDARVTGAANPAGAATTKSRGHRRANTNPSLVPEVTSSDEKNPKGDLLDRPNPSADSGGNEGEAPGSLKNYRPFSWRANARRTLSEGVMVGGGRSTPLRPSFFISLPEEEEPLPPTPPLPPPPSLSLGGRRPSVGPVNPRAMYGHVPPPLPDDQPQVGIARRPSVVIVPPPSPRDQGEAPGISAAATGASTNAAQNPSKAGSRGSSENEERRRGRDAAEFGSGASMRKSKSSGSGMRDARTNLGAASSPNVLCGLRKGMVKVEKVRLGLAGVRPHGEAGFSRDAQSESVGGPAGLGMGVAGAFAPTAEVRTAWHQIGTRDTVAPLHFTEASVRELRKLAAAAAARRGSSSSSGEDGEGKDGGGHGRCRPEEEVVASSRRKRSSEQQLRTMAGVDLSSTADNPSRRRPSAADTKRRSSTGINVSAGSGGQEGGFAHHLTEGPEGKVSDTAWTNDAARTASVPSAVASSPTNSRLTPWDLRIDVGTTKPWTAKTSGQPPAAVAQRRKTSGGGGENERSRTGRFRGSSGTALDHGGSSVFSNDLGDACLSVRPVGPFRSATMVPDRNAITSNRSTSSARRAHSASRAVSSSSGAKRRAEQGGTYHPAVARVRVRVRSSIYLILAEAEKDGSVLLAQVMEAETARHGQKAATVTGLKNESTGDTVDMDVPAERSISSGDSLIALIVGQAARSARSPSPCLVVRPTTAETSDLNHGAGEGDRRVTDPPRRRGGAGQRLDYHQASHRQWHVKSPSYEGPRPSPLRLEVDSNDNDCGDEGRGGDIDQLREDVARHLYKERLLAGGGAGAASPPTRPIGSAPITPVTGGGRGASPEHSRPTSPRPGSPTRSACSAASGYTHCSGFSVRSYGRGGGKGPAGNSDAAFLAQSTLTPEELDGILKEELLKSRKWSARNRTAQDRIRRVWEERADDYARLQREHEEAEAARQDKARERRDTEAAQAAAKIRQRTARAELALQQARSSRGSRDLRAKAAEAAHRRRMQQITERKDKEQREHAAKVQTMDRRREDVRDSFLEMVDAENETAIQALETPLETLNRALEEGDEVAEKKARRAMLRQAARERVHVRDKAARVLADQRRLEQKNGTGNRARQRVESSMMPGPGQYNLRDFSEYGNGAYSRPLV
ncbi:unnamed protein product, partial [Scytosiphon promiscuus]